ncbi:Cell differentiation protein rcd1 [Grifola frondosa]|uniref:Cell differentiation protein rcd1 n=1 Tax=Grifola frondosa TaxID=5627 RepID=A0A1C7LP59_GRIFR|nr:Cell differentiation protein rcd1 [Grifola frondosa]
MNQDAISVHVFIPPSFRTEAYRLNVDGPQDDEESWSDSDEEIENNVETAVQLGVPDGIIESSSDILDATVSRIGGHPAFLSVPPPSFDSAQCKNCSKPMHLLMQIWCPLEDSANDRALYIWGCANGSCQRKEGSIRAWRGLRYNEKYAEKLAKRLEKQKEKELQRSKVAQSRSEEKYAEEQSIRCTFIYKLSLADINTTFIQKLGAVNSPGPFGLGAQIFGAAEPAATSTDNADNTREADTLSSSNQDDSEDEDSDSDEDSLVEGLEAASLEDSPWAASPAYKPLYLSTMPEYMPPPPKLKVPSGADIVAENDDRTGKEGGWALEGYENSIDIDHAFERFSKRVANEGEQCLRYELGGTPLPFASDAIFDKLFPVPPAPSLPVTKPDFMVVRPQKRVYDPAAVSSCPHCTSRRVFECQLMPNLINVLKLPTVAAVDEVTKMSDEERRKEVLKAVKGDSAGERVGMEWGTCMIFSCEKDCTAGTHALPPSTTVSTMALGISNKLRSKFDFKFFKHGRASSGGVGSGGGIEFDSMKMIHRDISDVAPPPPPKDLISPYTPDWEHVHYPRVSSASLTSSPRSSSSSHVFFLATELKPSNLHLPSTPNDMSTPATPSYGRSATVRSPTSRIPIASSRIVPTLRRTVNRSTPAEAELRRMDTLRKKDLEEEEARREEAQRQARLKQAKEELLRQWMEEERQRKLALEQELKRIAAERKRKEAIEREAEALKAMQAAERKRAEREKRMQETQKLQAWRKEKEEQARETARKREEWRRQITKERRARAARLSVNGFKKEKGRTLYLTGWITIQAAESLTWKRRYFHLTDEALQLFKDSEETATPLEIIELSRVQRIREWQDGFEELEAIPCSFALEIRDRRGQWRNSTRTLKPEPEIVATRSSLDVIHDPYIFPGLSHVHTLQYNPYQRNLAAYTDASATSMAPLAHPAPHQTVGPFTTTASGAALGMHEETKIYGLVIDLLDSQTREGALLELSKKREQYDDLALVLWHSFGIMPALLQEIVSVYPLLAPPNLTAHVSNRVCNALALLQCVASHPETRQLFLNAHIPLFLYPFLNTTSKTRPFEYLRLTSLGVIGALVKQNDNNTVIHFLLSTEIIPLCLRIMETGSELSKTVAIFIVQKILLDETGLTYICHTYERFYAVGTVLSNMVNQLVETQAVRLLKHVVRCYLRLSDNLRAREALRACLPEPLRDQTFSALLKGDMVTKRCLTTLLNNLNEQ